MGALAAAWIDDPDEAILYLQKFFEDREPMLITVLSWPNVPDNLKNDSRGQEIIEKINFPS
jgi:hypothetical protein